MTPSPLRAAPGSVPGAPGSVPGAPASSRLTKNVAILSLPILLLLIYTFTNPFSTELSTSTFSLSQLSPAQKTNIEAACRALNGFILKPGEEFSFNRTVGPRTDRRGYTQAPSYLGPDSPRTFGGGICLVSSAVYQTALKSNFQITERVPHLRTIASVLPGLDATVWYGQADLRFRNTSSGPIRIESTYTPSDLHIRFLSSSKPKSLPTIRRMTKPTRDHILVQVFKESSGKSTLVSRDLYSLCR
jgi:vancomycin resistance protein VanW